MNVVEYFQTGSDSHLVAFVNVTTFPMNSVPHREVPAPMNPNMQSMLPSLKSEKQSTTTPQKTGTEERTTFMISISYLNFMFYILSITLRLFFIFIKYLTLVERQIFFVNIPLQSECTLNTES